MLDAVRTAATRYEADVIAWRRALHRQPELSTEETQTAQFVVDALAPLDLPVRTGLYDTGVMATLTGDKPGPTVFLRADMDALPIQEETELDFASQNEGVMHACGHDAHTAMLLGAAYILDGMRADIHGAIRFCFQPSEERLPGGAPFLIEEGVLDDDAHSPAPEVAYGQHVAPDLPAGTIGVHSGMYMASADEVHMTIHGEGGHAAAPHELSSDAVVAAAHVITALQSVNSRHRPPDVPSVLSLGRVQADGATNVLPGAVRIAGTFRAMDEAWRQKAHGLIERIATHTARAHGATATVDVQTGYPALYNHEAPTALARNAALDYVGEDRTIDLEKWYAGEDFAYYLQECPGSLYRLGTGSASGHDTHGLHTPRFTINEDALSTGAGFMAYLAWRYGAEASRG